MTDLVSQAGEDGVFVFDNVSSIDALSTMLNHDWLRASEGYVWRGHRKSSWKLEPTLDRALSIADPAAYSLAAEALLNRFQLAARGRIPTVDVPQSPADWWALAQHHGLSTPLLDWTTSPYVAAFFAFAESKDDDEQTRSIYMLHHPSIARKAAELGESGIHLFTPRVGSNARLISQSGLFSQFPCATDIESWVRSHFAGSEKIVLGRLEMPNSLRHALLQALNNMNINYKTLFPDLEGAAKHVSLSLSVPRYLPTRREGETSDF